MKTLAQAFALALSVAAAVADAAPLTLQARQRSETAAGSGRFHAVETPVEWNPAETAIIVCDMWNQHWCKGATARVAELAPRMNEVLKSARDNGVLIIHSPSSCLEAYDGTSQRKLAQAAPVVATARPIEGWRHLDPSREGALPIDDADGGCDCQPQCAQGSPWNRQIAALDIGPGDAITDNAEAIYLMSERGIKNVIVMGVHTNMCVLGRPFGIRQLVEHGKNVVLMRDMTDTMYNSRQAPLVSHFSGTDLIVDHIERFWCPTVTSADLTGEEEFRFSADRRPHVAFLIAEDEYDTARTLTKFAAERLQKDFRISLIYDSETDRNDMPGIEALRSADLLVVSVRRRTLPAEHLALVREHVAQGKPVVGIRTASHAFLPLGDAAVPPGTEAWPEFDHDVLGGHYTGHYGNKEELHGRTVVQALATARPHPILDGVPEGEFEVDSWLYKVEPLAETATPLMTGRIAGNDAVEAVAWTNAMGDSRVFYTSLGHPEDFQLPAFNKLLENGIRWAVASSSSRE